MFVLIFSIFATVMFRRKAREKGCDLKKPTAFPLLAGLGVFLASLLVLVLTDVICIYSGIGANVQHFAGWVVNFFFLGIYFVLITRAWRSLTALPDRRGRAAG